MMKQSLLLLLCTIHICGFAAEQPVADKDKKFDVAADRDKKVLRAGASAEQFDELDAQAYQAIKSLKRCVSHLEKMRASIMLNRFVKSSEGHSRAVSAAAETGDIIGAQELQSGLAVLVDKLVQAKALKRGHATIVTCRMAHGETYADQLSIMHDDTLVSFKDRVARQCGWWRTADGQSFDVMIGVNGKEITTEKDFNTALDQGKWLSGELVDFD
jgi:hypothetical protein